MCFVFSLITAAQLLRLDKELVICIFSINSGRTESHRRCSEDALLRMCRQGASRKELCEYFKRTSGGIAARLVRLGVIQSRDEFRYMA